MRHDLAVSTVDRYRWALGLLANHVGHNTEMEAIDARAIHGLLRALRVDHELSERSLYDVWVALSSFWTWAEVELSTGHIIKTGVKRPKFPDPEIEPLTRDEIQALLKAAPYTSGWKTRTGKATRTRRATGNRDQAIILLLVDTGLRVSELCGLELRDYEADQGRLYVRKGKGNKRRYLWLGQAARRALWRYLTDRPDARPTDALLCTNTNKPLDRSNVYSTLARIAERAGVLNVHPHRLRHTFAIQFLRNGSNIFELQKALGHEDIATVQVYVSLAHIDSKAAHTRASPVDNWKL